MCSSPCGAGSLCKINTSRGEKEKTMHIIRFYFFVHIKTFLQQCPPLINKWRRQYKHTKMSMNAECLIPSILSLHLRLTCLLLTSCFLSAQGPILLFLVCYPTAKIPWFLFTIIIKTTVISSLWNFVKKLVRRLG